MGQRRFGISFFQRRIPHSPSYPVWLEGISESFSHFIAVVRMLFQLKIHSRFICELNDDLQHLDAQIMHSLRILHAGHLGQFVQLIRELAVIPALAWAVKRQNSSALPIHPSIPRIRFDKMKAGAQDPIPIPPAFTGITYSTDTPCRAVRRSHSSSGPRCRPSPAGGSCTAAR